MNAGILPGILAPSTESKPCDRCGHVMARDDYAESAHRWSQRRSCGARCKASAQVARRAKSTRQESAPRVVRDLSGDLPLYEHPVPRGHRVLPVTREECRGGCRPCPLVSCRHNTFLDVLGNGEIRFTWPDREIDEVPPHLSCVLDIIERPHSDPDSLLREIGEALNLTSERVRQIEATALRKLLANRLLRESR